MCRKLHDFQRVPVPSRLINSVVSCSFSVKYIPSTSKFIQHPPKAPGRPSAFHCGQSVPCHAMQMHLALTYINQCPLHADVGQTQALACSATQPQSLGVYHMLFNPFTPRLFTLFSSILKCLSLAALGASPLLSDSCARRNHAWVGDCPAKLQRSIILG